MKTHLEIDPKKIQVTPLVAGDRTNSWETYKKKELVNSRHFYKDRGSVDRNSVDRNCVLSLDRNYVNHLTEFHLTESVDRNV